MSAYSPETMTKKQLRRCYSRYSIALLLTLFSIQAAVYPLFALKEWLLQIYPIDPFWNPVVNIIINDIACYLPPVLIFMLLLRPLPKGPTTPVKHLKPSQLGLAAVFSLGGGYLILYLGSLVLMVASLFFQSPARDIVSEVQDRTPLWLTLIAFALVAPLCEELIFRGILLRRLCGLGDLSAVLLSALAFGLFHMNLIQLPYAFVLGMVFAVITLLTGSIRDTVLLHMFINGTSSLVHGAPTLIHNAYYLSIGLCIPVTLYLFFTTRKKYHFEAGPLPFTSSEKKRACLGSLWFWLALLSGITLSVLTVFF